MKFSAYALLIYDLTYQSLFIFIVIGVSELNHCAYYRIIEAEVRLIKNCDAGQRKPTMLGRNSVMQDNGS